MGYMRDWLGQRLDAFQLTRDLPPIVAWHDFAAVNATAGNTFNKVLDKSGNGFHLLEPASSTKLPTAVTAEDGKLAGRFANNKQLLNPAFGNQWPVSQFASPLVLAVVVKMSSAASTAGQFPTIFGGIDTNSTRILLHGDSGVLYLAGRTATAVTGPNVKDDTWHVVVATIDSGASCIYVDGQLVLTGSVTTGTDFVSNLGFQSLPGDVREAMVIQGRLTAPQLASLHSYLAGRAPVAPTMSAYPRASGFWEQTTSSNGQAARIWTPDTVSTPKTLVMMQHQYNGTEQVLPNYFLYPAVNACLARGWYVAMSNQHANNWGFNQSLTDMLDLYNTMAARDAITNVVLVGVSMGGLSTALAASRGTIPHTKACYFMDGAVSLLNMFNNATYQSPVKTAWGITSGTLSGATTAGATSLPTTASFPTPGTQLLVGNGTANAETVTTTGASTGTAVAVTACANAHASGDMVSDYPTKTVGNDPLLLSMSTFAGLRMRFTASTSDADVLKTGNADAMTAALGAIPTENTLLVHGGVHLTGVNGADLAAFVQRSIS